MSNEIEIIKRHISKPIPFEIENEDGTKDVLLLKPLNVAQQTHLMILGKNFNSLGLSEDKDIQKKLANVDDEKMKKVTDETSDFFVGIVKGSVEGITDELAREFVDSNFENLMDFTDKLIQKTGKQENIEKIKERMKARNEQS